MATSTRPARATPAGTTRPRVPARSGVTVQLCGDAHLSNFGLFGTPERQMLFDINDFDETRPAMPVAAGRPAQSIA